MKSWAPMMTALGLAIAIPAAADSDRQESVRCLSQALGSAALDPGGRQALDAFAVMDVHTGQVVWWDNERILAQHAFQPASIFKVVTAYAALEAQAVDAAAVYRCRGWQGHEGPAGRSVRCWLKPGHGPVNLAKALAYSCNLYFAQLGQRLSSAGILRAARAFGLGSPTGSDFSGEVAGRLPDQATVQDAARLAIGQGEGMLVSPLQVLSLIGAVANGGVLWSPRRRSPSQRGVIEDAAALRFLRLSLEEASTFGTGSMQHLHRLRMAGKTGTAAWREVEWKTHGWYMGYWPMRAPQLALVAFVHRGNGAGEAATLARRVLERTLPAARRCGLIPPGPEAQP